MSIKCPYGCGTYSSIDGLWQHVVRWGNHHGTPLENQVRAYKSSFMSETMSGSTHPTYGKKLSEEHKEKIRQGNLGKTMSQESIQKMKDAERPTGEDHPMYGKHHTEETKQKISQSLQTGNSTEYPSDWWRIREKIRERDNRTCQICRRPSVVFEQKLDVHHIDANKENVDWSNLITLCHSCHARWQMQVRFA